MVKTFLKELQSPEGYGLFVNWEVREEARKLQALLEIESPANEKPS
jgi:hypothetical protein